MNIILFITILGTAIIAAVEANNAGMKKDRTKGTYSATEWFFIISLMWLFGYPIYLYKRKHYNLPNIVVAGLLFMLIFLGSWIIMTLQIEEAKTAIRSQFLNY